MKMDIYKTELKDWCDDARRALEREREKMMERVELMDGVVRAMEAADEILAENESLKDENVDLKSENETLQAQLQTEKELRTKAEMQLGEMSKLSAGVAKKASQDEVQKALRVFVNKSKRKKVEKRIAVKEMVLELANANGMALPEDLSMTIDCLDDEQVDARVVNVAGNYNDIHDNGSVNRM
jgi:hypothetical protein